MMGAQEPYQQLVEKINLQNSNGKVLIEENGATSIKEFSPVAIV